MANRWPPWIESVRLDSLVDITSTAYQTVLSLSVTPKIDARARIMGSLDAAIVVGAGDYSVRLQRSTATPTTVHILPAAWPQTITVLELVEDLTAGIQTTWQLDASVGTLGDTLRCYGGTPYFYNTWIHLTAMPWDGIAY